MADLSRELNTIYIGKKPVMSYVMAIITHFTTTDSKEVVLKARGRAITTAVDVAEIARRRFMKDINVSKVTIGTEEMPSREGEGRARMVSAIEITLTRE